MGSEEIRNSGEFVELSMDELDEVSGGKSSKKFVKATGNVHVRKGPGLEYAIMGTLSKGTLVSYLGSYKRDDRGVAWGKVNYNGSVGWVSEKYAKLV